MHLKEMNSWTDQKARKSLSYFSCRAMKSMLPFFNFNYFRFPNVFVPQEIVVHRYNKKSTTNKTNRDLKIDYISIWVSSKLKTDTRYTKEDVKFTHFVKKSLFFNAFIKLLLQFQQFWVFTQSFFNSYWRFSFRVFFNFLQ